MSDRLRLGVLASHPIQYQAPLYRALAERMSVQVFFAHRQTPRQQAAAGFGVAFDWDIDLLQGYSHEFLRNRAANPSVDTFFGCDTPQIFDRILHGHFDAFLLPGWNLKCFWQAIVACHLSGTPVMVRGDSQLGMPGTTARQLVREVTHRAMLRSFHAFLVVGKRHREYLRHYGVPDFRLFDAPHFVDNAWFRTRADEAILARDELRAELGFAPATPLLLFVGKLIPKKRPHEVVQALARLHARHPEVGLVVVGSGPLEPELRAIAAEHRLPVAFAGFRNQSELPAFYAMADLLVLPSDGGETWGLVVNEAMACGLPAVVSDAVGCGPDLVIDGVTGARFPLGDVESLAAAMDRALPLRSRADTQSALGNLMSRYSLDAAAAGVEEAVRCLAAQRSDGRRRSRIARLAGSSIVRRTATDTSTATTT